VQRCWQCSLCQPGLCACLKCISHTPFYALQRVASGINTCTMQRRSGLSCKQPCFCAVQKLLRAIDARLERVWSLGLKAVTSHSMVLQQLVQVHNTAGRCRCS
jgi:hypothetical protein